MNNENLSNISHSDLNISKLKKPTTRTITTFKLEGQVISHSESS